jgi:hypothetical protein
VGQFSHGSFAAGENKGSVRGYYRIGATVGMEEDKEVYREIEREKYRKRDSDS